MFRDVELTQAARAEVARLSLAVRAARRDAEQAEADAADLDRLSRSAEKLLEASIEELLEARRSACDQDLAEERAAAAGVLAEARDQAARAAAVAEEAAAREEEARRRVEAEPAPPATPAPPLPLRTASDGGLAEPVLPPAVVTHDPATADAPKSAPAIEPPAGAELEAPLGPPMSVVPVDELREIVRGAVVVGLREAMEQAAAMMHLAPPLPRQVALVAPGVRHRAVEEAIDEHSFRQRFFHLDVLLPLVAALIVIVLFFAWMG